MRDGWWDKHSGSEEDKRGVVIFCETWTGFPTERHTTVSDTNNGESDWSLKSLFVSGQC